MLKVAMGKMGGCSLDLHVMVRVRISMVTVTAADSSELLLATYTVP